MRTTTVGTAMPADLGGRLRYLRQRAGLPPEKIALELGLTARMINDWERNYREPRLFYLGRLATLYGVPIETLIGDTDLIAR